MTNKTKRLDPLATLGKICNFGTFGLFVIFAFYAVDDWSRISNEESMLDALVSQDQEQRDRLFQFRAKSKELGLRISDFQARTIDSDQMPAAQDRIVELAKSCQCVLKKSTPKGVETRPYIPSNRTFANEFAQREAEQRADFVLHSETMSLGLDGSLQNLQKFLYAISAEDWLCSTRNLAFQRKDEGEFDVSLDFELTFVGLKPNEQNRDPRYISTPTN